MNLNKLERYLRVNLLGPGPRLMKKEFTGPRSHKVWETLLYTPSWRGEGLRFLFLHVTGFDICKASNGSFCVSPTPHCEGPGSTQSQIGWLTLGHVTSPDSIMPRILHPSFIHHRHYKVVIYSDKDSLSLTVGLLIALPHSANRPNSRGIW